MSSKKIFILIGTLIVIGELGVFFVPQVLGSYYFKKGLADFNRGNYDEAEPYFELSKKFNPGNPLSHFYLGVISLDKPTETPGIGDYYPNARYEDTIAHLEKAMDLNLESKDAKIYSRALWLDGFSLWNLKERDKAVSMLNKQIKLNLDNTFSARYIVATEYFNRMNRPQEAFELLAPAPALADGEVQENNVFRVYTLIARLHFFYGNYEEAKKSATLVLETVPVQYEKSLEAQIAHNILGLVAGINKNFSLAEEEFKKTEKLAGSPGSQKCFISEAYYLGKDYNKAIQIALNKNLKKNYLDSFCYLYSGKSYLAQKRNKEAKEALEKFLEITSGFKDKNAVTVRDREFAEETLKNL